MNVRLKRLEILPTSQFRPPKWGHRPSLKSIYQRFFEQINHVTRKKLSKLCFREIKFYKLSIFFEGNNVRSNLFYFKFEKFFIRYEL